MRHSTWLTGLAVAVFALAGQASIAQAQNSQQAKMSSCNADAKTQGLTGADRQSFMKSCLSSKPADASAKPLNSQQQKMKTCNADATAKGLKGDDRKTYMKSCLSGSAQ
jgi:hypothetical protein